MPEIISEKDREVERSELPCSRCGEEGAYEFNSGIFCIKCYDQRTVEPEELERLAVHKFVPKVVALASNIMSVRPPSRCNKYHASNTISSTPTKRSRQQPTEKEVTYSTPPCEHTGCTATAYDFGTHFFCWEHGNNWYSVDVSEDALKRLALHKFVPKASRRIIGVSNIARINAEYLIEDIIKPRKSRQHPEADFQNQVVIPFLELKHYRVFHAGQGMIPDRKNGGWRWSTPASPSFPDILAVPEEPESIPEHWPLLIAWECKAEDGKATEGQYAWLRSFAAVPRSSAKVIRPSDWDMIQRMFE